MLGLFDLGDERRDDTTDRAAPAPGRVTLTAKLPPSARAIARAVAAEGGVAPGAGPIVERAAQGGGAALPERLRGRFERSLGADLGGVRLHTDGAAADASAALGARAYAVGQDVFVGAGHYAPDTDAGARLLAHEVAHTVQQRGAAPAPQAQLEVSSPGDALEHEADVAAVAMMSGLPTRVSSGGVAVARVMRDPLPGPAARADAPAPAPAPAAAATPSAPADAPNGNVQVLVMWRGSLAASLEAFFAAHVRDRAIVADVVRAILDNWEDAWDGNQHYDRVGFERALNERAAHVNGPTAYRQGFTPAAAAYVQQRTGLHLSELADTARAELRRYLLAHPNAQAAGAGVPRHAAPAQLVGPDVAVVGSQGAYHMAITLRAEDTGDDPLEATRQIDRAEYQWEVFQVGDPADAAARARIARGEGHGRAATADDAHQDDLARIDHDLSRDTARASGELDDARHAHDRTGQVVAATNILLTPTSAAVRYGEYALDRVYDRLVGDDADRPIPFREPGTFIVRCTATPRTIERYPSRAPSIAIKPVTVREVAAQGREADAAEDRRLQAAADQVELTRAIDPAHAAQAERDLSDLRRRLQSLPVDAITVEIEHATETRDVHQRELDVALRQLQAARDAHDETQIRLARYRVEDLRDDVSTAQAQLDEVTRQRGLASSRHAQLGEHSFRPHAQIIDEGSSDRLALLWEMSLPAQADGAWHCRLSDMTTPNGGFHEGSGPDARTALWGAVREFARMNTYGRGRLFVRLPDDVQIAGVEREADFENAPGSTTLLRQRLQDLGTVATALAAVTGVGGTVAMLAGAASSSINIAERIRNHTFRLDAEAVTDLLTVLSAAASGATVIGRLRVVPNAGGIALVPIEEAGAATRAIGAVGTAADHGQTIVATQQLIDQFGQTQADEDAGRITPSEARTRRMRLLVQHVQAVHGLAVGAAHAGDGEPTGHVPQLADPPAGEVHAPAAQATPPPAEPTHAAEPAPGPARMEEPGVDPDHRDAIPPPAPVDPQPAQVAPAAAHDPTATPAGGGDEHATPTVPDEHARPTQPDADARPTQPDDDARPTTPDEHARPTQPDVVPTPEEHAELRELQRLVQMAPELPPGTRVVPDRAPGPLAPTEMRASVARARLDALGLLHGDPHTHRVLERAVRHGAQIHAVEGQGHYAAGAHINVDPIVHGDARAQAFIIAHEAHHAAHQAAQPRPEEFTSYDRFRRQYMLHEARAQATALEREMHARLAAGGHLDELVGIPEYGAHEYFGAYMQQLHAYVAAHPGGDIRGAVMSAQHAAIRALQRAFADFPVSGPRYATYEQAAQHAWDQAHPSHAPTEPPAAAAEDHAASPAHDAPAHADPAEPDVVHGPRRRPREADPAEPATAQPAAAEGDAAPRPATRAERAAARDEQTRDDVAEIQRVRAHGEARIAQLHATVTLAQADRTRAAARLRDVNRRMVALAREHHQGSAAFESIAEHTSDPHLREEMRRLLDERDEAQAQLRSAAAEITNRTGDIERTPMPEVAARIYEDLRAAAGGRPEARAVRNVAIDVLGYRADPREPRNRMTTEHIHPLVEIVYTPGFAQIGNRELQLAIINDPENLAPLVGSINSQRNDRAWDTASSWLVPPEDPARRAQVLAGVTDLAQRQEAFRARLPGLIATATAQAQRLR